MQSTWGVAWGQSKLTARLYMTVVRESGAHEIGKPNPSDFVANEDVIGIIRPRQPRRIEDCSANTIPSLDIEIADCLGYKKKSKFW